jgi:hypothetical protein
MLYPKTNSTLLGKERYDDFHVSGYGTSLKAGLNLTFFLNISIFKEKREVISMGYSLLLKVLMIVLQDFSSFKDNCIWRNIQNLKAYLVLCDWLLLYNSLFFIFLNYSFIVYLQLAKFGLMII